MTIVSVWFFPLAWQPFICALNKTFHKQGALETGDASLVQYLLLWFGENLGAG
jgi:hypothetical protein